MDARNVARDDDYLANRIAEKVDELNVLLCYAAQRQINVLFNFIDDFERDEPPMQMLEVCLEKIGISAACSDRLLLPKHRQRGQS